MPGEIDTNQILLQRLGCSVHHSVGTLPWCAHLTGPAEYLLIYSPGFFFPGTVDIWTR